MSINFWGARDCNMLGNLVIVQFWLLCVLTVRKSSAIREGLLTNSRKSIASWKGNKLSGSFL